jgi:ribonuclease BN (tRNA processing enzyme)
VRFVVGVSLLAASVALLASVPAAADPEASCPAVSNILKSPPAGPHGLRTRVVTLGTGGGPRIRVERSQPSNLLIVDDRAYFIDVGHGALRQLADIGMQPKDVGKVFITHLHVDHMSDLAALMAYDYSNQREETVDIYGPPGTEQTVKNGIAFLAIPGMIYAKQIPLPKTMPELFAAHDLDVGCPAVVYQDDKVRVIAVENTHYQEMKFAPESYGHSKSYSYRFETPDRVVVFTGDTGPSKNLETISKGADILVSEAIDIDAVRKAVARAFKGSPEELQPLIDHQEKEHIRPEDIGKLATKAGVKMVVLTHLAGAPDVPFNPLVFSSGVRKNFSGTVVVAQDLDQF